MTGKIDPCAATNNLHGKARINNLKKRIQRNKEEIIMLTDRNEIMELEIERGLLKAGSPGSDTLTYISNEDCREKFIAFLRAYPQRWIRAHEIVDPWLAVMPGFKVGYHGSNKSKHGLNNSVGKLLNSVLPKRTNSHAKGHVYENIYYCTGSSGPEETYGKTVMICED